MMKELVALLPLILVKTIPLQANTQQEIDSSTNYIHLEKASFKSKVFQKAAAIFNAKKIIEKKIVRKKYNQNVAPLPKSLLNNFKITVDTIKGRKYWTLKPQQNVSEKSSFIYMEEHTIGTFLNIIGDLPKDCWRKHMQLLSFLTIH